MNKRDLAKSLLGKLMGLEEEKAVELAKESGLDYRVISRDGKPFIITCDYRFDRLNFEVIGGKVVEATLG